MVSPVLLSVNQLSQSFAIVLCIIMFLAWIDQCLFVMAAVTVQDSSERVEGGVRGEPETASRLNSRRSEFTS